MSLQQYRLTFLNYNTEKCILLVSWIVERTDFKIITSLKRDQIDMMYVEATPEAIADIQKEFDWISSVLKGNFFGSMILTDE